MKTIMASVAALAMSTSVALAEPVLGIWQTAQDDNGNYGHIAVGTCGDTICGELVRAYNGQGQQIESDNVGRRIIWNMQALGDGAYGKGKIYSPDRDKTYSSKMQLTGDVLTVQGCVFGICRDGGTWTRVN